MSMEKEVSFKTNKTYSTLNTIDKNQNIWFACHGIGQLSHYFLNNFLNIPKEKNYIIAPQAPSKYYHSTQTKRVGACWLTKENTQLEQHNIFRFFDEILNQEKPVTPNIFMGFSQGVSVMLRYLVYKKLNVNDIVIMSGKIPEELKESDFNFLSKKTKVWLSYGLSDPLLNNKLIEVEINKSRQLFGERVNIMTFDGKHEIDQELILNLGNS
jgi:predicted esterase